jgi:ketosteroid isomerase-like protein
MAQSDDTADPLDAVLPVVTAASASAGPPPDGRHREGDAVVAEFQAAIQARDLAAVTGLLQPDVTFLAPNSLDGLSSPRAYLVGREQVLAYFESVFIRFSQVRFTEVRITAADHGQVVFFEAGGDFITAGSGVAYRNRYVFRFEVRGNRIIAITEYDNPTIYCRTFGFPAQT